MDHSIQFRCIQAASDTSIGPAETIATLKAEKTALYDIISALTAENEILKAENFRLKRQYTPQVHTQLSHRESPLYLQKSLQMTATPGFRRRHILQAQFSCCEPPLYLQKTRWTIATTASGPQHQHTLPAKLLHHE